MSPLEKPVTFTPKETVATLSNFMRVNYGSSAQTEAARHVVAYCEDGKRELADIWMCVVEELQRDAA